MRIVEEHNEAGSGQARYDEAADSFVFSFSDVGEEDVFAAADIEGRELYPIGAFC